MAQLQDYSAALATPLHPLRLAWLADDSLGRFGIDQGVTGGDDYNLTGVWAAAVHNHAGVVDGIFYATQHHNRLYAMILFERGATQSRSSDGRVDEPGMPDLWVEAAGLLRRFETTLLDEPPNSDDRR